MSITSPADGETLYDTSVRVQATASSPNGIRLMRVYLDGTRVHNSPSSSIDITITAPLGSHVLRVEAIDQARNVFSSSVQFTVAEAESQPAPEPEPVAVSVSPSSASVEAGQTVQFSATVTGTTDTDVTWTVPSGGGTVDATGLYTAPAETGTATVRATSVADPTKSADASVTIVEPATESSSPAEPEPQPGLVAAYGFEEGSGSLVGDVSGNGHHGTLTGGSWDTGRYGGALSFSGSGWVDVGSLLPDGTQHISASAWVYRNDTGDQRVLCKATDVWVADHVFCLGVVGSGSSSTDSLVRVRLGSDSGATSHDSTATFPVQTWTHIGFTYDGSQVRIYINGEAAGTYTRTGGIKASAQTVTLANINTTQERGLNGRLDDVRVYDRALTQTEMQADMQTALGTATASDADIPLVEITSPVDGSVFHDVSSIQVLATATSLDGIQSVRVLLNGSQVHQQSSGVVDFEMAVTPGDHTVVVEATSTLNVTGKASARFTVTSSAVVGLSWDASPSVIVGYYVYRSDKAGGPYTRISGAVEGLAWDDPNVASGSTYYYVVTAVDSAGRESVYSNEASAVIP